MFICNTQSVVALMLRKDLEARSGGVGGGGARGGEFRDFEKPQNAKHLTRQNHLKHVSFS